MLIAHEPGKEIRPGIFVWSSLEETAGDYLSIDDGKRWPCYVSIEQPEDGKVVSRFYEIYCLLHPDQREESNQLKASNISYTCIKEDQWSARSTEGGKFLGSREPYRNLYELGTMSKEDMEAYIR